MVTYKETLGEYNYGNRVTPPPLPPLKQPSRPFIILLLQILYGLILICLLFGGIAVMSQDPLSCVLMWGIGIGLGPIFAFLELCVYVRGIYLEMVSRK